MPTASRTIGTRALESATCESRVCRGLGVLALLVSIIRLDNRTRVRDRGYFYKYSPVDVTVMVTSGVRFAIRTGSWWIVHTGLTNSLVMVRLRLRFAFSQDLIELPAGDIRIARRNDLNGEVTDVELGSQAFLERFKSSLM